MNLCYWNLCLQVGPTYSFNKVYLLKFIFKFSICPPLKKKDRVLIFWVIFFPFYPWETFQMQSSSSQISNKSFWAQFGVLDLKIWPHEVEVPRRSIIKPWKSNWMLFKFMRETWLISDIETYFIIFLVELSFQQGIYFPNQTPGSQVMVSRNSPLNNRSFNSRVNLSPWSNFFHSNKILTFYFKLISHVHGSLWMF